MGHPVCCLELQGEGHLDLAWCADGVLDVADVARRSVEGGKACPYYWLVGFGGGLIAGVLRHLGVWNIEAGVVGQVEYVEGVAQVVAVGETLRS